MKRLFLTFQILFLIMEQGFAEVLPIDGSILHYTNINFEENVVKKAALYRLEVQIGKTFLTDKKNNFSISAPNPAFQLAKFEWDQQYTWRVIALSAKQEVIQTSAVHYFKTYPKTHSAFFSDTKLNVRINDSSLHNGGYIAIDYMRGIFNRQGEAIWTMPDIKGFVTNGTEIRDIKITAENTLTFLADNKPLEIDYYGNVLWSVPQLLTLNGDTLSFHHEFQKKGKSYYILANHTVYKRITNGYVPGKHRMVRDVFDRNGELSAKAELAVITEIDKSGKMIYSWDANSYITEEDLNFKKGPDNFPLIQAHANGLGIDERHEFLFVSFRDLGRVIKIDKKSGRVVASFGQKYPSGEARLAPNIFKQQHDGRPTNHGTILIFNNNGPRDEAGTSGVLELDHANGKLLFNFNLDFDTLTKGRSGSGGNVNELSNLNLLICAGQLNRLTEITREKKIVWDAFTTSLSIGDSVWKVMPNYRCSWVNKFHGNTIFLNVISLKNTKENVRVNMELYNLGEIQDSLILKIHSAEGSVLHEKKLETIDPGKKSVVKINVKLAAKSIVGGYLTITSLRNWSSVKKVQFEK